MIAAAFFCLSLRYAFEYIKILEYISYKNINFCFKEKQCDNKINVSVFPHYLETDLHEPVRHWFALEVSLRQGSVKYSLLVILLLLNGRNCRNLDAQAIMKYFVQIILFAKSCVL